MKSRFGWGAIIFVCVAARAWASDPTGWLPPAHEIFHTVEADPRELQYALRFVSPVSRKLLGEAAIGDYLGLYRFPCVEGGTCVQINAGGGVFGRFDLSGTSNDMESVDWYANLPVEWRRGKWSGRFMLYHTSAHLGDDFLKTHGGVSTKHSWDNLRALLAYQLIDALRVYGGYTYAFRTLPENIGRHALQGGAELTGPWMAHEHARFYWANDVQSWQRNRWNVMWNSQLGVHLNHDRADPRYASIFVEFEAGKQPQGQFFLQNETRWNFGLKLSLS